MRIAYLVHDVNDPAVQRRIRMLSAGGAKVTLLGFSRERARPRVPSGMIILGHTADARLVQRVGAVARAMVALPKWYAAVGGADVIIARQLETLALAVVARRLCASNAPLIYECLDIHRLMLSPSVVGRLLRRLEASLLSKCKSLMVSSGRFVEEHFYPAYRVTPWLEIVENKVLATEVPDILRSSQPHSANNGPPWKIGWYGIIRCQRSLDLLAGLAMRLPGLVEVTIRGRIARNVLPDFDRIVAETPGIRYEGPYDRHRELAHLYTPLHFFWAIDFYEAGGNSNWLLPNRLYEGSLFGAVPLAVNVVETGRWLAARGVGVLLGEPLEAALAGFFADLEIAGYRLLRAAMASIPQTAFLHSDRDCELLTTRLLFGEPTRARDITPTAA